MENNHDIDKKFNEASKRSEEPVTFPGFDKVWDNIEQKLDKKQKKRILPLWIPYGIAASLVIGLGAFYFVNKKEVPENQQKNLIVKNNIPVQPHTKTEVNHTPATDSGNEAKAVKLARKNKILAQNMPQVKMPKYIPQFQELPELPETEYREMDISEVVVTGASGIKKRSDAVTSSSAMVVSSEKVSKRASSAVIESLSGKVAGIMVSPGKKHTPGIIIRGVASLSSGSVQPLFVIDGVVVNGSEVLTSLNPKKIKAVSILKGTEATALYGSSARNGVVVVKTTGLSKSEMKKLRKISVKEAEKEILEKPEPELPKAGQLTAGEVNDFSKWNYWKDIAAPTLESYRKIWKFFPERRVSVQLINQDKKPVVGEKIKLINSKKEIIWESVSDNLGNAELWINPMGKSAFDSASEKYFLSDHTGRIISSTVKEFKDGQNIIIVDRNCLSKRTLELAFVVDATGSMGDEISYLQSELLDVLKKVESNLKNTKVRYGSVFYRDKGDEYVTRKFDFSEKAEDLVNFIKKQGADGGGDTPEAVLEALQVSIEELKWSEENSTKIMFLILDAPPHRSDENITRLYEKIRMAAKKGITIIPLAASDTDKQTEYLMRTFALLTNGTYTFLTNDSGIGNDHIKPTIDSFEVEKMNDLLLRLILQRATLPKCSNGISNDHLNKKMETEINNQQQSSIVIFPNPTKGIVNIKSQHAIDELFVYDLAGKIIMRKERLPEGKNTIDIMSYPQSFYLLRIKSDGKWETFKLIKN